MICSICSSSTGLIRRLRGYRSIGYDQRVLPAGYDSPSIEPVVEWIEGAVQAFDDPTREPWGLRSLIGPMRVLGSLASTLLFQPTQLIKKRSRRQNRETESSPLLRGDIEQIGIVGDH